MFSLNLFNVFRNVCFCKLSLQHTGPTFLPGLSTSGSATSRVACFFLYLSINARVLVYSYALEMVWYEYVLVLVCILVCTYGRIFSLFFELYFLPRSCPQCIFFVVLQVLPSDIDPYWICTYSTAVRIRTHIRNADPDPDKRSHRPSLLKDGTGCL